VVGGREEDDKIIKFSQKLLHLHPVQSTGTLMCTKLLHTLYAKVKMPMGGKILMTLLMSLLSHLQNVPHNNEKFDEKQLLMN
jgi:hypothetical protein